MNLKTHGCLFAVSKIQTNAVESTNTTQYKKKKKKKKIE